LTSKYTPDDRIIEGEEGKRRVAAALEKLGGGVITSRDAGLNDILFDHFRPNMPPGVDQWQLPVKLDGPVFFFLSVLGPGAIVPSHEHKRDLFRVVVSGSLILEDGRELKGGDWMYVPAGASYSVRAGLNPGAIVYHCYG
jgi:mannose-6-phosphate isomerase-like protein (cupin superfamily)